MFKVSERVLVEDHEGTIKDVHNLGSFVVYIVELDNGMTIKTFEENLIRIQEDDYEEESEDTITISRMDLKKAVIKATDPNLYLDKIKDPTTVNMLTLSGLAISLNLEDILFGEGE